MSIPFVGPINVISTGCCLEVSRTAIAASGAAGCCREGNAGEGAVAFGGLAVKTVSTIATFSVKIKKETTDAATKV